VPSCYPVFLISCLLSFPSTGKYMTIRLKCDTLKLTDAVLSGIEGLTHLFGKPYARYEIRNSAIENCKTVAVLNGGTLSDSCVENLRIDKRPRMNSKMLLLPQRVSKNYLYK